VKIRAAVSRPGRTVPVIEELDLAAPRADEVLVRIRAAGVCHTDLRAHQGGVLPTPHPVVLGHEGAGIVEAVGAGVLHLRVGDHVVLSGSSCGVCSSCRDNHPTSCLEVMPRSFGGQRMDGSSALSQQGLPIHGHFFGQSSFATHAIADGRGAVRIEADVPFAIAAPLGCGVLTGAGAVLHAFALKPGATLVVFGAGSVGLSAIMAARLAGASQIIAVEPRPQRRALALELGATAALDAGSDEVPAQVRQLLPQGADFALNTTVVPQVYEWSVQVLAMRGVAAFVSVPPLAVHIPLQTLLSGARSLRGIINGDAVPQRTIPLLIDHWRRGRFPMDRLITAFGFEAIADAFAAIHQGTVIKPVLLLDPS
jgi:aryl-alcohol dehydrogenase